MNESNIFVTQLGSARNLLNILCVRMDAHMKASVKIMCEFVCMRMRDAPVTLFENGDYHENPEPFPCSHSLPLSILSNKLTCLVLTPNQPLRRLD
ncbi:hypothetical protein RRG08_057172 [Elysia crispata]|uniref:Uncharacterized protein n=1 Tax=Elysia crispata TaxID=231223 RepID=A0AAE0XWB2_9GAST|nr:hypothetical protein RRG08_057172 [Elysia crispata]